MGNDSASVQRCQRRKKIFAIEQFGGKCCICGYNKCINALEFHHIDKDEKYFKPAYIIMRWSWKRAKKELEKCILLCSNCHREAHYLDLEIDLQSNVRPFITKTCQQCYGTFDTRDDDRKFCSDDCHKVNRNVKSNRPSRATLKDLLDKKIPWTHLGRMFDVSDNAVRKWAKKYELI